MTGPPQTDALAPVREALLRLARQEQERLLAEADLDAGETTSRADDEAEQVRASARAEAEAEAAAYLAAERSRADRAARAEELRARRTAYEELLSRARAAARSLADEPDVRHRLEDLARATLGQAATVSPTPDGGVVAETGGRRATWSLAALADEAVAELVGSR